MSASPAAAILPLPVLQPPRVYPPFLRLSILFTVVVGSALGTLHLVLYYGNLGALPIGLVQVHGHVQLLGFAGLFVCGVALHCLPRFTRQELPAPRTARATAWVLAAGVLLRAVGQPLAESWAGRAALIASGALELAAGAAFASVVLVTLYRSGLRTGWEKFAAAGAGWLAAACAFAASGAGWLAGGGEAAAPAVYSRPFVEATLYGFALQWIMAVLVYTGPVLWRLQRPRLPLLIAAFFLVNGGTLAAAAGASAAAEAVFHAGAAARALGLLAFSAAMLGRPGMRAASDASHALIRASLLWLWVGALAALAVHGRAWAWGEDLNPLVADALRHLFTLGVVAQMLVGMSTRMVPVFGGVKLAWPRLRTASLWLLNAAVVLRSLEAVAALGAPLALRAVALAGPLAYGALLLWGASLWVTLDRTARRFAGGAPTRAMR